MALIGKYVTDSTPIESTSSFVEEITTWPTDLDESHPSYSLAGQTTSQSVPEVIGYDEEAIENAYLKLQTFSTNRSVADEDEENPVAYRVCGIFDVYESQAHRNANSGSIGVENIFLAEAIYGEIPTGSFEWIYTQITNDNPVGYTNA